MNFFDTHKKTIRKMLIDGCNFQEIATAINVPEKKLRLFIESNRSARDFVQKSIELKEENLLSKIADSDKWHSAAWLLSRQNPKRYSDTGVRIQAETAGEASENELLQTTIRVRDSIIEIHYRHFEQGHDWTLMEGGSRSGKTYNFLLWAYLQTRLRKFDLNIIAPSHKTLSEGPFADIKKILAEFDPEIAIPERPTKLNLRNGSRWIFEVVISELEAKRNRDNVFVNEADGMPEIIANLLGRASGRKFADYNPVKKFWAANKINETGSNILRTSWRDNPYLTPNQLQWLADLKKNGEFAEDGSPERYAYEVYYLGNYSLLSGKAYDMADFDIIEESDAPTKFDYYMSYTDPSLGVGADYFASLFFGILKNKVYALDCIFSQFTKPGGFIETLKKWDEISNNTCDHYSEKNGTSGVVTRAVDATYTGVLSPVNNQDKKEADIIVYSTIAKHFKFVRSQKMIEFLQQCAEFPNAEHDDAPDCLSRSAKLIQKNYDI